MSQLIFIDGSQEQFTEGRHHQRNTFNCPPDDTTSAGWPYSYRWRIQPSFSVILYDQWIHTPMLFPGNNYSGASALGGLTKLTPPAGALDFSDGFFGRVALQYYKYDGGFVFNDSNGPGGPNLKSRGKWKLVFHLAVYYPKAADPDGLDARNYLFINLFTEPKEGGGTRHLIRDENNDGAAELYDGIPADAIPNSNSYVPDVRSTYKIELTQITATPENPFTFDDTIIVPEELFFCRVQFGALFYHFGPNTMQRSTALNINFPAEGTAAPTYPGAPDLEPATYASMGAPHGWGFLGNSETALATWLPTTIDNAYPPLSAIPHQPFWLPGEWAVPIEAWLENGAVGADTNLGTFDFLGTFGNYHKDVTIWAADLSAFRIAPLAALFNLLIDPSGMKYNRRAQFTDASLGEPAAWDWDFGDGTAHSTQQNPLHDFPNTGTFTVTLTVTDTIGDTDTAVARVEIIPPIAEFTFTPAGYPGGSFNSNESRYAVTYEWDFGDGLAHSNLANPFHNFPAGANSYPVRLTVTSANGDSANVTHYITIGPVFGPANFTYVQVPSPVRTIQFTDLSAGNIVDWKWYRVATPIVLIAASQNPLVQFPTTGNFQVILDVYDQFGFLVGTIKPVIVT